jgi:hypothetical protein
MVMGSPGRRRGEQAKQQGVDDKGGDKIAGRP